ncbi:MAG: methyltransferase domain-containing protein [Nitrospira sp.]|nr:methyltransferase domain-containing protein [Nitrospira sp.]MDH5499338.1 methyltransferase domain-containing protein [Nitrospira sp.]MDH5724744.1 methyltransferase domain-containing protein [Nitrospira sp.]
MSSQPRQKWNPKQYAANARFVPELGLPVIELLSPRPGEAVLDLGCGDGALTLKLVELGCDVVGVDSSPDMVAAARSLGLNVQVMDGHTLSFCDHFDAVFSNAALHWMKYPERVIAAVRRALRPSGRFVGEFGGYGNVATIVAAIESSLSLRDIAIDNPWYFPRPEEYRTLLEAGGFTVSSITLIPRPTPLPGSIDGWLEMFAQPYTSVLPTSERQGWIAELVEALRPTLCDADGNWQADYVRVRFCATKTNIEHAKT